MKQLFYLILFSCLFMLGGCAKNPVTGHSELHFVSTKQEIKIGSQNYLYGQQASGGKYTLDPALTDYVNEVGQKLAHVSDRPDLPFEFVVLNDSIPNAWALPGGKIAINRGLLTQLNSEAELAAVLGHEITHAAARHSAKAMERQLILTTGLVAANVIVAIHPQTRDSRLKQQVLMGSAAVATRLISTKYSREAELEADAYGIAYMTKAGYDPFAAVSLQEMFVKLSEKKSSRWINGLFASHPPSIERARINLAHAEKITHPPSLVAVDRYQAKLALLKKRGPAYEAFDKGVKAYQKEDFSDALGLAEEAIQLEPEEALFYGLKGDVLTKKGDREKALIAYNKAIDHGSHYFYYYHQRGLLLEKMGRRQEAKADLQKSQTLLPTESAAMALEKI